MSDSSAPRRPRILWLHNQPDHYFNLTIDELARGGGAPAGAVVPDYVTAFSFRGPAHFTEYPLPNVAPHVILRPAPGHGDHLPAHNERYHLNWWDDLYPLRYDAAIVGGYGSRTHREFIRDCRHRGVPLAMWSDSNLRAERGRSLRARMRRRLKTAYLRRIIGQVDFFLTANSRGVAYWRYYGAPRERIIMCPCYADYARLDEARRTPRGEVLGRLGLPADARILYSAARLAHEKGLDTMIRAFRQGNFAQQGWHYLIAGAGPLEAELQALAGDLNGAAIRFLGFQQPRDNLALMAHADLFVLPSRYEPHGIVVGESLAGGTPVLASDVVGAAADLVRPRITGATFRTGDVQSLADRLGALLADPANLAAMRPNCRARFESWMTDFNPIKVVQSVAQQLLAMRGGRRS